MIGADLPAAPTVGAVEEPLADIRVDVEREVLGRRPTGEDKAVAEDPLLVFAPVRGAGEDGDTVEYVEDGGFERALHAGPVVLGDEFADLIEARLLLAGDITDDIEVALAGGVVDDARLVRIFKGFFRVSARGTNERWS